jgi:hypothetical protein
MCDGGGFRRGGAAWRGHGELHSMVYVAITWAAHDVLLTYSQVGGSCETHGMNPGSSSPTNPASREPFAIVIE